MAASGWSNFVFFSFVSISFFPGVKSFWIFDVTSAVGYIYLALFCLGCLAFGVTAIVVIVCMIQESGKKKRRVTHAPVPNTIVTPGYYGHTVSGPSTVGAPGTYQMTPLVAPGYGYKTQPQQPMGYQNHGGPPPSYAQPTGAQATPGAPPMEAQPGNQSVSNDLPPSYSTTIGSNSVAPTVVQPAPVGGTTN